MGAAAVLLASAAAGCVSRCIVHPLDTVRSRLMVSRAHSTLLGTFREVLSRDGIRGLYRGFGASLLLQAPAVGTYLTTYEYARDRLREATPNAPRAIAHLAAGLAAEATSAVFWTPMEVVKQRAQVRAPGASAVSSRAVLKDLLKHEGPRALFSGYTLTVAVFGPYAMVYFVVYEKLKEIARGRIHGVENMEKDVALPTPTVCAAAATAGAVAAGVTSPLDVVKTRVQTQGDAVGGVVARERYRSVFHAVNVIVSKEGFMAFWKGVSARVLWIMPGTAITMSTFEFLKQFIPATKSVEDVRQ